MDNWTEEHELAAMIRLFEIALERLRARGLAEEPAARNLACRAVSTEQEFTTSLASVAHMTREQIRVEVAHVYRTVAERAGRQP